MNREVVVGFSFSRPIGQNSLTTTHKANTNLCKQKQQDVNVTLVFGRSPTNNQQQPTLQGISELIKKQQNVNITIVIRPKGREEPITANYARNI